MTAKESITELEKCKNSISYFYNNYCRKEGMPEYSEEAYQSYIELAQDLRNINGYFRRGKAMLMMTYPLTPNECIPVINKNSDNF